MGDKLKTTPSPLNNVGYYPDDSSYTTLEVSQPLLVLMVSKRVSENMSCGSQNMIWAGIDWSQVTTRTRVKLYNAL